VDNVLGLARTGLAEAGIPYHVMSRWVPVGEGAARQGLTRGLGACGAGPVRESGCLGRAVHCCVFSLFVLLLFLFPSVCCSVKLPLSRPTSFLPLSFHSPLHAGRGRGGRVALLLLVAAETKTGLESHMKYTGQWLLSGQINV